MSGTLSVDVRYRPLRIAWAITAGDREAFRQAVRVSYAFWGGRFNPIVVVERESQARQLMNLFRVDAVIPLSDSPAAQSFPDHFPHLRSPLHGRLFSEGFNGRRHCEVLDVVNALVHLRDSPDWAAAKQQGFYLWSWQPDDPLADVFLATLGGYPSKEDVGIGYEAAVEQATGASRATIVPTGPIPAQAVQSPTIPVLCRSGVRGHHGPFAGWENPGFFYGDAASLDDLLDYWNLRAAGIFLCFIDRRERRRFDLIIPEWLERSRKRAAQSPVQRDGVAAWASQANLDEAKRELAGMGLKFLPVSEAIWNGQNVRPPTMYLGESSTLGVVGQRGTVPTVSFALRDKPFSEHTSFLTQHCVASVSFVGGLYDDDYTLMPPFVPELNEFYGRAMHVHDEVRSESERIGIIVRAVETDTHLAAVPVADLFEKVFGLAGFRTRRSGAGLITMQLIHRLGGLQGARAFKIPGVRRLLKTYGPTQTFTWKSAMQLIGGRDPENPDAKFADHEGLFIGPRARGTKLKPHDVFVSLVEKGLFRIGAELRCPVCRLASWIALDDLQHQIVCSLCGREYDATRQLVSIDWHYRRSGVLGLEKHAQGAVPVALTLQQLDANLDHLHESAFSPSLDLIPRPGVTASSCEVDFAWLIVRPERHRTALIFGECKDRGGTIEQDDIDNLRFLADALPPERFSTFVLLTKLSPFTPAELDRVKSLNVDRPRVILMTARELEPYDLYDRTKRAGGGFEIYGGTPEDMARVTEQLFFRPSDSQGDPTSSEVRAASQSEGK